MVVFDRQVFAAASVMGVFVYGPLVLPYYRGVRSIDAFNQATRALYEDFVVWIKPKENYTTIVQEYQTAARHHQRLEASRRGKMDPLEAPVSEPFTRESVEKEWASYQTSNVQ